MGLRVDASEITCITKLATMTDIESKQFEEQSSQLSGFARAIRPVVGTCMAISALALVALSRSSSIVTEMAAPTQLEVVKQGKQPIVAGCANIYGSDPDQVFIDPDTGLRVLTAVFTICDDRSLNGVALNALVLMHNMISTWVSHTLRLDLA